MIIAIGEILVDIFPHYKRIGGAPFNFAYHLKQLGLDVVFITRIGDDPAGAEIFSFLENNGFPTDYIQIDKKHETGRVIVTPDASGEHAFEIIQNSAYDHIEFPRKPSDAARGQHIEMIYFGTLAQRTPSGFNSLQAFLSSRDPESKCFYDINLRPGNYRNETLLKSLANTDILKLNAEELDRLRKIFHQDGDEVGSARYLIEHFGLEMVSLTKGPRGSALITADDHKTTGVAGLDIVDTVGAGDAYAAVLAAGLLAGLPPVTILGLATDFSSRVCTIKGAIPDDPGFYEPFRSRLAGAANV